MTTVIKWKHIREYQYTVYKIMRYYGVILDVINYIMTFWDNCNAKPYFLDYKLLTNKFNIVDIDNTFTFKTDLFEVADIKNINMTVSYGHNIMEIQFNKPNSLTHIISNITKHFDHNIVKSHLLEKYSLKYTYDYYDENILTYRFMMTNRKNNISTLLRKNGIIIGKGEINNTISNNFDDVKKIMPYDYGMLTPIQKYKSYILLAKAIKFEFSIDHLQLAKGFFKNPYYVNFCVNVIDIVN